MSVLIIPTDFDKTVCTYHVYYDKDYAKFDHEVLI